MFVAVVFYILLIIEGEVWNVKAEVKAMNLRTGIRCFGVYIQMEFFDTKWTRYFQLSCSGSLLGCETNQLLFSVSASYSSFTWASRR